MADELGSIHEIDASITLLEKPLTTLSRSDPRRIPSIVILALERARRYKLSNQSEDCDKLIIHLTELILLQPRSWLELGPTILVDFFVLAVALVQRSKASSKPEDSIYAAKYLRHLRDQHHAVPGCPRQTVTAFLVDALAYQVEFGAHNLMQCMEEMAVLCYELLTSNASDNDTTRIRSITCLATVVSSKITPSMPDQLLNQVIECLRLARKQQPDLRLALAHSLACSLTCRYVVTCVNDDYEEAVSIWDEFISSGDSRVDDAALDAAREIVTTIAQLRSTAHENPEYSEEAIYRTRTFFGPSSEHSRFVERLTAAQRYRFFGSIESQETPSGDSPLFPPALMASLRVNPETGPTIEKLELLGGLLSGILNIDITEIDEAIERGRTLLASPPTSHIHITPDHFVFFGRILFEAFKRTNKIEYLNESISTHRQISENPLTHHVMRPKICEYLLESLVTRSMSFPNYWFQDLDEVIKVLTQSVNNALVRLPLRFRYSCVWAAVARLTLHPSISKAYESAFSLMQDTLLFSPTLQQQHATLADSLIITYPVSLDYASYKIDLHRLEEAVETLERGRALLWSEMRHLRASIDQLQQEHPQLGHEFIAINKDLEELTKSTPPSYKLSIDDDAADNSRGVDPFGRLLLKQRELLKERDSLTSRIRDLPGFDSFLKSPSFDALRSAASSGPVIIINYSESRSDILILLHNTSPSLIPTSDDFYDRASALKNKLLDSRLKYGLDSSHYGETLASVLAELYDLVGKPVIDRLDQLQVPRQSRIWWCPTSVFCSLPLHAMGPIPSDDREKRYFLDLYICSYTPTLSALIQSRTRDSDPQSSDRPPLLLVAQPDPSLPTVGGEIQVVQALDTEVTSLISDAATPAAVIDGFHHHRFVHFACHGTLETGKPFEAGFELYGERLTLLEIVRSHLPIAEFAFLSACHTAEVTEGSMVDEGLHLAAAVQYCGFRSVVGTTWAMVDEDGRDLAEHFYKALFDSKREQGTTYHERSAKALRFAVKKLRRKRRISLERWVNFVHYGA
ncbi:CHAT domain-containing protein [Lactarius hatsudake]|nr:CHAT domain-containing protein [Lactarius hatsudake]